jgi:hypothetical protein
LRETVQANQWSDELHGKDPAAKNIARQFVAEIEAVRISPAERAVSHLYLTTKVAP